VNWQTWRMRPLSAGRSSPRCRARSRAGAASWQLCRSDLHAHVLLALSDFETYLISETDFGNNAEMAEFRSALK